MSSCMVMINGTCVAMQDGSPVPSAITPPPTETPMSTLLILLIVFGGIAAYGFIGGFAGEAHMRWRKYARRTRKAGGGSSYMDGEARFMASILWPIALLLTPLILGVLAANWTLPTEERREAKQKKKDIERQCKLELLRAEEARNESALKLLEANGVNARVDWSA